MFSQDAKDNFNLLYELYTLDKEGYKSNIENKWNYKLGDLPYIDYSCEYKGKYKPASLGKSYITGKTLIDKDNDFLLGDSGGLLMNINFIFIGTDIFSKVGDGFDASSRDERKRKYCPYEEGTIDWELFWKRETRRRKKGCKANCKLYYEDIPEYFNPNTTEERKKELLRPLRITGEHYTYLNYGRIDRVPNKEESVRLQRQGSKAKTVQGFPRFWDGDYWNFKLDEFIALNDFHLCKAKARRKGFSFKRGSQAANTLNLYPDVTVTLAADKIEYLTGKKATTSMAKRNLDWFEKHTYWQRGYASEKITDVLLGFKVSDEGNRIDGWQSNLYSVSIGVNESAAIGRIAIELDFEEAGKCPNLKAALNVVLSNTESGDIQVGTIRVYGTGGTKDTNWKDFEDIFNSPRKYKMLELENIWDINRRQETCGFFFPNILNREPDVEDGNSLLFTAWLDDKEDKERQAKELDGEELTIYIGQRANTPAEAFVNTKDNMFASPELTNHVSNLKTDSRYKIYEDGWFVNIDGEIQFYNKHKCINNKVFGSSKFHEYVLEIPHRKGTDVHGCIRMYHPPYTENGKVPDDLYFVAIDSIKVDKDKDDITDKHSLYSMQVWMYPNNYVIYGEKLTLVCEWIGRLDTMKECDIVSMNTSRYYNAKALPEAGTGETITNYITAGLSNYLMLDPTQTFKRNYMKVTNANYGIVIDGERKTSGLIMYKSEMYTLDAIIDGKKSFNLTNNFSLRLNLELLHFGKGNFDAISTAIIAMYVYHYWKLKNKDRDNTSKENETYGSRYSKKYKR